MKGEFTVLTEAVQVKIKQLIIDGVLNGEPRTLTFRKIRRAIENYAVNCPREIRDSFVQVLWQGALKLYPQFRANIENVASAAGVVVLMLGGLLRGERKAVETAQRSGKPVAEQLTTAQENIEHRQAQGGTVEDYTEYIYPDRIDVDDVRKKVKAKIRELSETETESGDGHNLRNRAEMYVRHEAQQDSIEQMRKDGVKLVWASTHVDCSRRCAPWQGKLYSLDGTYGEINGKKYQPLENATDIWYTTKAGKRWKNGLLGFNCYDDQTEVYTDQGWKHFAELNGEEKVLTLNPETRGLEWQKPTAYYCKEWHGEMTYLHNQNTNLLITPDHSCLYFTQKNSALRFREAKSLTAASFLYAGCEWQGNDCKTIDVCGYDVDSELYCKLLAYYLADGSKHCATAIKIAQTNNDEMFAELSALPFKIWHDDNKIVIHNKQLTGKFAEYGHATEKYIPEEIKGLSRRLLNVFLNAYVKTDGYTETSIKACGVTSQHRCLFTTSKRMADDLSEIALKAGLRPKFEIRKYAGTKQTFKNGTYTINNDLYVIHLNWRTTITHFTKESVHYDGNVYCVEVPNHTLYVRRNGQTAWCGNCRHRLVPYNEHQAPPKAFTAQEMKVRRALNERQRALERGIRKQRALAWELIHQDGAEARRLFAVAKRNEEKYREFCRKNNLVALPYRTQVMREEI